MKKENPLANGSRDLGIIVAGNGLWVVWRTSPHGKNAGVTVDGFTFTTPATAKILVRDLIVPNSIDHWFDPKRAQLLESVGPRRSLYRCGCGCGLVMLKEGSDIYFGKDEASLFSG